MSAPEAPVVLDLFAGTGWGVACQWLGIEEYGVEIMPEAVATREANGMKTIYRDVWDGLTGKERTPNYQCLIASPPCQTFSLAGHGAGRAALDEVLEAIRDEVWKDPQALIAFGEKHDPRTALVLAPLAYVWRDWPTFVAMEQVPPVLPVWEAVADVMRTLGYSVETGILNAEQYGVPQTRRRAILVARADGPARLPKPTHSRYYSKDPSRLDPDVLPWVSMAQALGWGMTDRPMPTITGGTHGPTDRWASGGNSVRKMIDAKVDGPDWIAPAVPAAVDSRTEYPVRIDVGEASALQSYPPVEAVKHMGAGMVERHGDRPGRGAGEPAFTVRASAGGTEPGGFQLRNTETGDVEKLDPEQAAALQTYPPGQGWGFTDRPAVTIGNAVGRGLIGGSGAKETVERALEAGTFIHSPNGNGDDTYAEKTRITVDEAATLQTYPAGQVGFPRLADKGEAVEIDGKEYRARDLRPDDQPAQTVTEKARSWKHLQDGQAEPISVDEAAALQSFPVPIFRSGHRPNAAVRPATHPAPTIIGGHDVQNRGFEDDSPRGVRPMTEAEAAALQSYPPAAGWGYTDRPAPTVCGGGGKASGIELWDRGTRDAALEAIESGRFTPNGRPVNPDTKLDPIRMEPGEAATLQTFPLYTQNIRQAHQARRALDHPAPTVTAGHDSSNRGFIGDDGSLTVATPEEVAALQSYPQRPFVWCGSKSKKFLQIGNAVPPLLAYAILRTLISPAERNPGMEKQHDDTT